MTDKLNNFINISGLNDKESAALQNILSRRELLEPARMIAERQFASEPPRTVESYPESAELSQIWFAAAFLSFDFSRERYRQLNFPESVWRDSMTDLKVWLRNEERNNHVIGLGQLARPWQVVLYQGKVTRHGRLECNSDFCYNHTELRDSSGAVILSPGDPVINLHIPEDGPLDLTLCSESLQAMADFFAHCRPDYHWKGFLCESWLLDRQLQTMLPENANIIKFQQLGIRYLLHPTEESKFRIFGTADIKDLSTPTRLQQKAAEFLQHGGQFMEEGLFIPRQLIERMDFDLNKLLQTK